ncbi:MAG: hypothetical protein RSC87_10170, partial [Muribaculaceae bacterium]
GRSMADSTASAICAKQNVEDVPHNPQVSDRVKASGVQRLRRRNHLISQLPHNCIVGLNFRTKVLKWNVFDVLASQHTSHTAQ